MSELSCVLGGKGGGKSEENGGDDGYALNESVQRYRLVCGGTASFVLELEIGVIVRIHSVASECFNEGEHQCVGHFVNPSSKV